MQPHTSVIYKRGPRVQPVQRCLFLRSAAPARWALTVDFAVWCVVGRQGVSGIYGGIETIVTVCSGFSACCRGKPLCGLIAQSIACGITQRDAIWQVQSRHPVRGLRWLNSMTGCARVRLLVYKPPAHRVMLRVGITSSCPCRPLCRSRQDVQSLPSPAVGSRASHAPASIWTDRRGEAGERGW